MDAGEGRKSGEPKAARSPPIAVGLAVTVTVLGDERASLPWLGFGCKREV